jgi:hypothetical protein
MPAVTGSSHRSIARRLATTNVVSTEAADCSSGLLSLSILSEVTASSQPFIRDELHSAGADAANNNSVAITTLPYARAADFRIRRLLMRTAYCFNEIPLHTKLINLIIFDGPTGKIVTRLGPYTAVPNHAAIHRHTNSFSRLPLTLKKSRPNPYKLTAGRRKSVFTRLITAVLLNIIRILYVN